MVYSVIDKSRQCVEKQRHYSADKGPYNQGYDIPVVAYGYESWTIKKAECQRIGAFELWCWEDSSKSLGQKEIKPVNLKGEPTLEGLMLKLKLQYFGHLMSTANSLEKSLFRERLRAEGEECVRGCNGWVALLM